MPTDFHASLLAFIHESRQRWLDELFDWLRIPSVSARPEHQPDMLRAALAGNPLTLLSDGRATRAFCYLRDTVAGLLVILLHGVPGEAYNVGNDEAEMSMVELAERVARIAADPPLPVVRYVSDDPHYLTDNPVRRCPALSKLRGLGWTPEVGLDEGIARALASYREQPVGAPA
jgi:dTDP-glucose 4,6-dehydratase/UDP-glucuronate decarboxylase